ncbi:MAG: flavodoxin domain-containing protein [Marinoscillum sp.]
MNNVTLLILYGSQTGNAEYLSGQLHDMCRSQGVNSESINMSAYHPDKLASVRNLALIVSTHGVGEPPISAQPFYSSLLQSTQQLDQLNYAVLALGDTKYAQFCESGKDFDKAFSRLGASRIIPRVDCDIDYETQAREWMNTLIANLKQST